MFLKKQHKPHPSINRSNDMFIRPSVVQMAKMNKENPDKKVTSSYFEPETKLNNFGEPAFFQPQNTVQARMKKGTTIPKTNNSDSTIQKMPDEDQEIQAKANNDSPSAIQSSNTEGNSQTNNKTGIPSSLKSGLERLSGEDLSGVRVHRNSSKPDEIGAHAYAQGENIYLGQGQEKHLPHEGWHVVQQKQGRVQPTIQQKSKLINDDAGLEKEADVMGAKAVQMKANDSPTKAKSNRFSSRNNVIQRAMKFEWQISSNHLFRDNGSRVQPLPRKYGPEDFLVKGKSGVRLESESRSESEFETSWEKKWPKLEKQIVEAKQMVEQINGVPETKASDGSMYTVLPFSENQLEHLTPGQGFKASGTKWDKKQNTGKRLVSIAKENIRSSPEYRDDTPDFNWIGELYRGAKLKVIGESDDGKWIQFKHPEIDGWIYKNSTRLETKRYESNYAKVNNKNVYNDTMLENKEQLLAKVSDSTWFAGFQVSESFELGQFESYLKNDAGMETNVSGHGTDLMNLPIAQGASNELKNFVLMVVYFIQRARHTHLMKNGKLSPSKYAFKLMSRTNFGSIYKSANLSTKDRTIFKSLVNDKTNGIIPSLKIDRSTLMFVDGHSAEKKASDNPTIYSWLVGITQNKDLLSALVASVSGSMGKFDMNKEQGKNKNLVRFENRGPDNRGQSKDNWLDYAKKHFEAASTDRSRTTGKGQTGLEK